VAVVTNSKGTAAEVNTLVLTTEITVGNMRTTVATNTVAIKHDRLRLAGHLQAPVTWCAVLPLLDTHGGGPTNRQR